MTSFELFNLWPHKRKRFNLRGFVVVGVVVVVVVGVVGCCCLLLFVVVCCLWLFVVC